MNGGCHYPVFSDTLLEYFVLTSGRFEQCLILTADTLISIAHHFSRHERFTVEYTQVVLDDLSLDVVKGKVDITYFRTLAFRPVPFHVPKRFRDTLLIAELRHNPVNRYPSYDADNIVFLLVAVHVEQHFECTSCHTRFLFAKLNINELDFDTQIGDKRCNSISHMLNLTLSRVMICKPFFFLNPLFFAFPDFSACHHLTP